MNIDNNSQCVRSKYFVGKPVMDESLSDFLETKQSLKGPKTTQKAVKPKAKKVTKRIKGQKDIRTAIKGKKNELVSYTKEFDNICKKSGLDVDSEQLQLAIALSKSLQTETSDDASTSQSLTTQGRIAKIRTTLQEYGFTVPETKVTANKKVKKKQKNYKLLNTADEARHQKISSKYAQVLFDNLDSTLNENCSNQGYNTPIFNIATSLAYEFMKDNNIFYVDNLVEKSTTTGSLLRDWSEIPGRPESPIHFETIAINFSEIICSQEELDVILSGSIESAKNIIVSKQAKNGKECIDCDILSKGEIQNKKIELDMNDDKSIIFEEVHVKKDTVELHCKEQESKNMKLEKQHVKLNDTLTVGEQYRSCSPDIFDDEESCVMDTSKSIVQFNSEEQKTKVFTDDTGNMDFTQCANIFLSQNIENAQFISQDTTKRKSDDFMDITGCAVTASQGIRENVKEIDLTQYSNENSVILTADPNKDVDNNLNILAENHGLNDSVDGIVDEILDDPPDYIDLSHDFNERRSVVLEKNNVPLHKSAECMNLHNVIADDNEKIIDNLTNKGSEPICLDDIDLTQSSNEDEMKSIVSKEVLNDKCESMDLTQSSNSSIDIDDLPEINVGNTSESMSNLDDTIILNQKEYIGIDGKVKKSIIIQNDQVFDLTQAEDDNCLKQPNNTTNGKSATLNSQSFYDDFVHDHSDNNRNTDGIELHDSDKDSNDIDLTQSSNGSARNTSPKLVKVVENIVNHSSLGKGNDDISIDYDEIGEYISDKESIKDGNSNGADKNSLKLKYDSSKSQVFDDIELVDHDEPFLNSSQHSEVFDLTDKELEYSLHKSIRDIPIDNYNIDFGEISMVDEVVGKKSLGETNLDMIKNYTFISVRPEVNVRNTVKDCPITAGSNGPNAFSSKNIDAIGQSSNGIFTIVTPNKSEYTIKTKDVTPMLDYASMTTPQRNRELDKYGLKPLKRKRAIKMLTYLYNQTHPIIESYSEEEQPSTSKKPKLDIEPLREISPRKLFAKGTTRKLKSPKKPDEINRSVNSPMKEGDSSKDCVYEVTSEVPVVRAVGCSPDDWVFQKREKAKVHSCRVPLHIAFHNYVSSRRELRESILKYKPVNIDVIHKDLVSYGHRYDPKDLLKFLDKKCITVKTTDNNSRNKR